MAGRIVDIYIDSPITASCLLGNIEASFKRQTRRFHDLPGLGRMTGSVAIVGGGPSLRQELPKLRKFPGTVMSCGTVHDYLVSEGVIPNYHVLVDPDPVCKKWLQHPHRAITYLLASQVSPEVYDTLKGHDVLMWHSAGKLDIGKPDEGQPSSSFGTENMWGEPVIPGADFVIGRAWPMAAIMGFRDLHFFGFDCSFPEDCQSQHAYEYEWEREEPCLINIEGVDKKYVTTPGWMVQLKAFMDMLCVADKRFKVTIHGDNLVAAVCYAGMKSNGRQQKGH